MEWTILKVCSSCITGNPVLLTGPSSPFDETPDEVAEEAAEPGFAAAEDDGSPPLQPAKQDAANAAAKKAASTLFLFNVICLLNLLCSSELYAGSVCSEQTAMDLKM